MRRAADPGAGGPPAGAEQFVVPGPGTVQAIVRVKCEQKKLYADSGVFEIV